MRRFWPARCAPQRPIAELSVPALVYCRLSHQDFAEHIGKSAPMVATVSSPGQRAPIAVPVEVKDGDVVEGILQAAQELRVNMTACRPPVIMGCSMRYAAAPPKGCATCPLPRCWRFRRRWRSSSRDDTPRSGQRRLRPPPRQPFSSTGIPHHGLPAS
jgi:hypothetical protein